MPSITQPQIHELAATSPTATPTRRNSMAQDIEAAWQHATGLLKIDRIHSETGFIAHLTSQLERSADHFVMVDAPIGEAWPDLVVINGQSRIAAAGVIVFEPNGNPDLVTERQTLSTIAGMQARQARVSNLLRDFTTGRKIDIPLSFAREFILFAMVVAAPGSMALDYTHWSDIAESCAYLPMRKQRAIWHDITHTPRLMQYGFAAPSR